MWSLIHWCLMLGSYLIQGIPGQLIDDMVRTLFEPYEHSIRPHCGEIGNITTHVYMDLSLRQIIELNEPRQLLKINVWIRMNWMDCRLVWNKTGSLQLEHIMVPQNKVWIPDITLYDNAATVLPGLKDYTAVVTNAGRMQYNFPSVINSMCAIDVRFFPFDSQKCKLTFGSWAYPGRDINVSTVSNTADLTSYVENIEWEVLYTRTSRKENYFGADSFPTVTFELSLRRKPLFYVMNMIFPCLLITFVAVFGFMLPPDSGEKVNLEVTVMLSLAVFQLVVLDLIPASGDSTPIIGIYFMMSMILVGMSCLMTVVVLQIHFRGSHGRQINPWILRNIMVPLSKITCVKLQPDTLLDRQKSIITRRMSMRNSKSYANGIMTDITTEPPDSHHPSMLFKDLTPVLNQISASVEAITNVVCESDEDDVIKLQWSILAIIFDRLFLVLYLFCSVCATLGLMLQFNQAGD